MFKSYLKKINLIAVSVLILLTLNSCSENKKKDFSEDLSKFNKLEWIIGNWKADVGDANIHESWHKKNFRILEGMSYTTQKSKRIFTEDLRIEQSNNKIYLIITEIENREKVNQQKFKLSKVENDEAIFENMNENDYPQKIKYVKKNRSKMLIVMKGEKSERKFEREFLYKRTG